MEQADMNLADSQNLGWIGWLPARLRPFAILGRFDRPIGWWLLFWPCAAAIGLAGDLRNNWPWLGWFLLGAIAMRAAGCVYNDIIDRDLDARVARTAMRPLASGAVGLRAAWIWLGILCLLGLIVWFKLPGLAKIIALASLLLVAAYPFMKRITWWPQAWLGLVFGWGSLVGWAAITGELAAPAYWLYAGCWFWIMGYDTIYALQDIEDDTLVGIKSSARALGDKIWPALMLFYGGALACWAIAIWQVRPDPLALLALLPLGLHLCWQLISLKPDQPADALNKFSSNRNSGLLLFMACASIGLA